MIFKRDKNIPMIKSKVIRSNIVKGDKIIDFQFLNENFSPLIIGNELSPFNWFNVILDDAVDERRQEIIHNIIPIKYMNHESIDKSLRNKMGNKPRSVILLDIS